MGQVKVFIVGIRNCPTGQNGTGQSLYCGNQKLSYWSEWDRSKSLLWDCVQVRMGLESVCNVCIRDCCPMGQNGTWVKVFIVGIGDCPSGQNGTWVKVCFMGIRDCPTGQNKSWVRVFIAGLRDCPTGQNWTQVKIFILGIRDCPTGQNGTQVKDFVVGIRDCPTGLNGACS